MNELLNEEQVLQLIHKIRQQKVMVWRRSVSMSKSKEVLIDFLRTSCSSFLQKNGKT